MSTDHLKGLFRFHASGRRADAAFQGSVFRSIVFIASLFVFQLTFGQEVPETQEADERESMEEVIVSSPPSLRSMAAEVTRAQMNAFTVFNDLNGDDEYDVLCRRETVNKQASNVMGNYGPVLVCRTKFVRRETARDNELVFSGDFDLGDSDVDYASHARELSQKVNELISEHPEFQEAMSDWAMLKTNYDTAKAEDMKSNFFTRLFKSKRKS